MLNRVFFAFILLLLVYSASAQGEEQSPAITFKQKFLRPGPNEQDLAPTDSFHTLHLVIGGNLYQTEQHVACAYDKNTGTYNFRREFYYIQPLLNLGDISIANLKTSFGNNIANMFSAPDEFALAIKYSGLNTMMHANVHTANINKATLKRTRDLLNEFDMYHTGAFTDAAERLGNYPLIIDKKGFQIAVLNYTQLAIRPSISNDFIINQLDRFMIEHDMRLAKANKPDFIIFYIDWGVNDQDIPSSEQQDLVKYIFEEGADLVVGCLPNNPMRLDYMDYYYENKPREGIVAYSLGNLVASDDEPKNRNGYLLDMELQKNNYTGETNISDWGVIPVYTYYDTSTGHPKIYSVPSSSIENGEIFKDISYIEKRRAVNSAYAIRQLVGATADEIQYHLSEIIVNNVKETIDITHASLNDKMSPMRSDSIPPTAAPVLPVSAGGSREAPSLALLYAQPDTPKPEVKKPPEVKKESAYEKQRRIAEREFNSTISLNTQKVGEVAADTQLNTANAGNVKGTTMRIVMDTVYRIQFYVLKNLIPIDTNYYTHLKGYEVYEENGTYVYIVGHYKTYKQCYQYWISQMKPRYKQSTIVKFVDGRKVFE